MNGWEAHPVDPPAAIETVPKKARMGQNGLNFADHSQSWAVFRDPFNVFQY